MKINKDGDQFTLVVDYQEYLLIGFSLDEATDSSFLNDKGHSEARKMERQMDEFYLKNVGQVND